MKMASENRNAYEQCNLKRFIKSLLLTAASFELTINAALPENC